MIFDELSKVESDLGEVERERFGAVVCIQPGMD